MPLDLSQKREIIQLLLVAREYLRVADPPATTHDIKMGQTAKALAKATLTEPEWSQTMIGAHLASAAVRLTSIDEVLKTAKEARPLYTNCRKYFFKNSCLADDLRGSTCSEWFHVMLRDAVAHNEPRPGAPDKQKRRFEARQQCIATTTFGDAHLRLRQTEENLSAIVTAYGVVVPAVVL